MSRNHFESQPFAGFFRAGLKSPPLPFLTKWFLKFFLNQNLFILLEFIHLVLFFLHCFSTPRFSSPNFLKHGAIGHDFVNRFQIKEGRLLDSTLSSSIYRLLTFLHLVLLIHKIRTTVSVSPNCGGAKIVLHVKHYMPLF